MGIAGLAGALAFDAIPDVTPDLVLTAVFGGFFLGAGIGLAIRGGAVLDGRDRGVAGEPARRRASRRRRDPRLQRGVVRFCDGSARRHAGALSQS